MSSLRTDTAKGGLALASVAILGRLVNLAVMVFLARLLDPADFGLFALAMILFGTLEMFAGMGLGPGLIHSRLDSKKIAFPAFVLTSAASLLLFCIVFLGSPLWARVLGDLDVEPLLRWLSALILLETMALVPGALLSRELRFAIVSRATLLSQLIEAGFSLFLAFKGYGVWSLVYGRLVGAIAKVVLFWVACPGWDWVIPRRWAINDVRGLLRFGIQNTGSAVVNFFNYNWDDWVVGRVMGVEALGFYSKAYRFSARTVEGLNTSVVAAVLFPAFAQIQDEKQRLSHIYLRSLRLIASIMIPVAMGVLILAEEAIPVFLGDKWLPMVLPLQIFAILAIVRPLSASVAPVFMGIGSPGLNLSAGLVVAVVMVVSALLLLDWGIAGMACAVLASHVVGFAYNIFQMNRIMPGVVPKMISAIVPAFCAGLVMMLGVQLSKSPLLHVTGGNPNVITIAVLAIIGATIYLSLSFLLQRAFILEFLDLIVSAMGIRGRMSFVRTLNPRSHQSDLDNEIHG